MPSDAVIKLRPLRIRQRCRVRFQVFPDRIQQFCLLCMGEAIYLVSQIAHMFITLARFSCSGKRTLYPFIRNSWESFWLPFFPSPFLAASHHAKSASVRRNCAER